MTLKDISTGPSWIIWTVFIILLIISVVLLTGHGANLIAGYNTSSQEEKNKYDEKKLCRVVGIGMLSISILIFVMGVLESILPAFTAYVAVGIILLDIVIMIVLVNTICKKEN